MFQNYFLVLFLSNNISYERSREDLNFVFSSSKPEHHKGKPWQLLPVTFPLTLKDMKNEAYH